MSKKGPKPGTHYNQNLSCPFCDRTGIGSYGGLSGHIQLSHPQLYQNWLVGKDKGVDDIKPGEEYDATLVGTTSTDVRKLELENKMLKLAKERRSLMMELGDNNQRSFPDLSEVSGFGKLTPDVAQFLQSKAFGKDQTSENKPTWWENLTRNNSLSDLIALGRTLFGQQTSGSDTISSLATLLGILGVKDIRSLMGSGNSSVATAPVDFELPGVGKIPAGFPLQSDLLLAMMRQNAGDPMAEALTNAVARIGALMVADRAGHGSQHAGPEEGRDFVVCDICGKETDIPQGLKPGEYFSCSNDECRREFEVLPEKQEVKRKRLPIIESEPETVTCRSCRQLVNVDGFEVGSEFVCPSCGSEQILISEVEALPAKLPKKKD